MTDLVTVIFLIWLLPFIGGITALIPGRSGILGQIVFATLSFLLSTYLLITLWNDQIVQWSNSWFKVGDHVFTVGIDVSLPVAFMVFVVMLITTAVSIYSLGYMKDDTGRNRYHFALGLFSSAMLGIVLADNLLLIFVFWELVGFTSYLLINHYYQKKEASLASMKAFIVNRIGDAGFVIGLAILFSIAGTLNLGELHLLEDAGTPWLTAAGIALFLGVIGKSAQFPLQVWLPDAMEGPTPASALIHAATMVAAGVYLLFRTITIFTPEALQIVALTGAITAFMGAVAAVNQYDIKKVLAYSTISQLGYMVMAMGIGEPALGLMHLFTHAFFKAGLFLGAGAIIHSLHEQSHKAGVSYDAQDMRMMGGLRHQLRVTYVLYMIFTAALIGLPLTSGFMSKDAILAGSYAWMVGRLNVGVIVAALAFISVVLTAYYMTRQLILVFFGKTRTPQSTESPVKEVSGVMFIPMIVLAVGAIWIVWSVNPLDMEAGVLFHKLFPVHIASVDSTTHLIISGVSLLLILIGGGLAYWRRSELLNFNKEKSSVLERLSGNNWWLDKIYATLIVQPVIKMAGFLESLDRRVLDGIINGVGISYVLFSHIAAWFDKHVVDGFVHFVTGTVRFTGNVSATVAKGGAQWYVWLAVATSLAIMWLLI